MKTVSLLRLAAFVVALLGFNSTTCHSKEQTCPLIEKEVPATVDPDSLSLATDYRDLFPDTWVANDGLGRSMPDYSAVGAVKKDQRRIVGIFYITWHTQDHYTNFKSPYAADVTKVLEKDPKARMDAKHPLWTEGSYHWGEPEMGYFLSQDEYVIRKDISMLADAGVDVLVMDVTNAVRYWDEWEVLFTTMQKMKAEGNKVPQFCFWAFNGPVITVVQDLYDRLFKEPYPDAGEADFLESLNPDSVKSVNGWIEPGTDLKAGVWQFERLGYFAYDPVQSSPTAPVINRITTLKDTWATRSGG